MAAPAQPSPAGSPGDKQRLGLIALTALVVGNMVGSGVFLLPAQLAPFGGVSVLGWVVSAVGSLCFGLVLARLARRQPAVGGPYAYTREAFGEFTGFLVGWGYWISCWSAQAAIAIAMVGYLGQLVPFVAANPASVALVTIALLALVNSWGVREAGVVQVVTTVLKILPLAAIAMFGFARFERAHFEPFNPTDQALPDAVMGCLALTLWAFQGFESASIAAGDARDARRDVPRATLIGIAVATVLYVSSTLAVMGLVPRETLKDSVAPFADAAKSLWGGWAGKAVAAGAFVSCLGALNGWTLVVGRVPFAIARDGLFPGFFGRLSKRGTPAVALLVSSALACALVIANYSGSLVAMFRAMAVLSTLAALVPYVFCSVAEMILVSRPNEAGGRDRVRTSVVLGLLGFVYGLLTIKGAGDREVAQGFMLLLAGMPFYVLARARRSG